MAQIITNSNLSLGGLGRGVGANANTSTETKLAADGRGSTGTITKMSDFFCGDLELGNSAMADYWPYGLHISTAVNTGYQLRWALEHYDGIALQQTGSLFFERLATRPDNYPTNQMNTGWSYLAYYAGAGAGDQLFNITTAPYIPTGQSVWTEIKIRYADYYNSGASFYNNYQFPSINHSITTRSDIRLKENIEKIGTSPSNIPIYKFNYKGESTCYKGTMAQDLLSIGRQDAVTLMDSGYYGVDYNKLDISHEIFNGL